MYELLNWFSCTETYADKVEPDIISLFVTLILSSFRVKAPTSGPWIRSILLSDTKLLVVKLVIIP